LTLFRRLKKSGKVSGNFDNLVSNFKPPPRLRRNPLLPFLPAVKNYILDTNVLLHDPNSLVNFKENTVLVPIEVIEEIDRFKRESTELGRNARTVSRMLDGFRGEGSLSAGVDLPNGGKLKIAFNKNAHAENTFAKDSVDNRILSLAASIQKAQPKNATILVSKDINLRIKADAIGVMAEDYETDRVFITDLYTGMVELPVSPEKIAAFRAKGELALPEEKSYFPNEYCTLTDESNAQTEQQPGKFVLFAGFQFVKQVASRFRSHALQQDQAIFVQAV
jgi:PhoH-like ATPase